MAGMMKDHSLVILLLIDDALFIVFFLLLFSSPNDILLPIPRLCLPSLFLFKFPEPLQALFGLFQVCSIIPIAAEAVYWLVGSLGFACFYMRVF